MAGDFSDARGAAERATIVRKTVRVVVLYVGLTAIWLWLSDRLLFRWVENPSSLALWSTVKGLFFLAVTAGLLGGMLYRLLRRLNAVSSSLMESEGRFRDLYENAPDMYLNVEVATGNVVRCNEALVQASGYSREEIVGHPVFIFFPADCLAAAKQAFDQIVATGEIRDVELQLCRRDGTRRDISVSTSVLRDAAGRARYTRSVWRDITKRKNAERRMEAALNYSQMLLRNSPVAIVTCRASGEVISANPAAGEIIGAQPEQLVGDNFRMLESWKRSGLLAAADAALETGKMQRVETYHTSTFGTSRWLACQFAPFTHEGVPHLLCLFADVSERKRAQSVLEAANERLTAMFEDGRDAVFLADIKTGIIVDANREGERLLNRPKRDIIGRHQTELHPVELADFYRRNFAEHLRESHNAFSDAEVITSDGRRVPVEIRASCIRLPNGHTLLQGIFRDVSERRRTEEQVRKLSRAVEQSPVSIVITNLQGDIEYVNPKFSEVTGYVAGEVLGRNPRLLKSGGISAAIYRELWATITDGREWHGELHNRKKNGELFWEAASISPVRDAAGHITHFLALKEDITAHKLALERITEQAALLEQAQDAILVLNLNRQVTFCNHSAACLYHQEGAEMLGQLGDELLFPDDPDQCAEVCKTTLEYGAWSGEIRQTYGRDKGRCIQSRWSLVRPAEGRAAFLITNTDVTEKRRLEQQFLRAQRMESLGTLASGVAHDISNILSPILMSTEYLRAVLERPQDRDILNLLHEGACRGADITRQLLIFGRGLEGQRGELQVRSLLKEMVKVVSETFPKNIRLEQNFPADLWTVRADPTQIHQVLLNLCVNARDAMPYGGTLNLAAENLLLDAPAAMQFAEARAGQFVLLTVTDTGTGIPVEIHDKIFDPFFTTKEPGKGTGLGLSTALGIVKSHEGFMRVHSQPGAGTRFEVYLPALTDPALAPMVETVRALPRAEGQCVLLVDDEAAVRATARQILTAGGYRVVTAKNGAEAIIKFAKRRSEIRAVITDLAMPTMDGPALICALRQIAPELPIMAISGLAGSGDGTIDCGPQADAFLAKPFTAVQFVTALHHILAPHETNGSAVPS